MTEGIHGMPKRHGALSTLTTAHPDEGEIGSERSAATAALPACSGRDREEKRRRCTAVLLGDQEKVRWVTVAVAVAVVEIDEEELRRRLEGRGWEKP